MLKLINEKQNSIWKKHAKTSNNIILGLLNIILGLPQRVANASWIWLSSSNQNV